MIIKLDLEDKKTIKNILELQMASYIIEAELIGYYEIPPLKDTIDSLTYCDEIFYGYYIEETLAGIISYKIMEDYILDIHRVAIHPRFFRSGIAGKLIKYIEGLEAKINKVEVCTGKKNIPAINLYLKNGYIKVEDIEIGDGVYLTMFRKSL
jgi:ribosomal protein S18 acetylase RimI-like enzyme